jgi:hypothetical protein
MHEHKHEDKHEQKMNFSVKMKMNMDTDIEIHMDTDIEIHMDTDMDMNTDQDTGHGRGHGNLTSHLIGFWSSFRYCVPVKLPCNNTYTVRL